MSASKFGFSLSAAAIAVATFAASVAPQAGNTPEQAYSSRIETEAKHSSVNFVPDGDLTKSLWKQAQWVDFDNDASGKSYYPEAATRVASLWTEAYIYFAFAARYDSLNIFEGEDPKPERWKLPVRDGASTSFAPRERAATITASFLPGASFLKERPFTCQRDSES